MWPRQLGVIAGGQLGKYLCQVAANWGLHVAVLDASPHAPAVPFAHRSVIGDPRSAADVVAFCATVDCVVLELEAVNVDALAAAKSRGVRVYPDPDILRSVQDKAAQRATMHAHGLPIPAWQAWESRTALQAAIAAGTCTLPCVQKLCTGGYDGHGVRVLRTAADIPLDGRCITEALVPIVHEVSVIAAQDAHGHRAFYPSIALTLDPDAHLIQSMNTPAELPPPVLAQLTEVANATLDAFPVCGLLAIECFVDTAGRVLLNEVSPRPHNSGHHTLDGAVTSQYEQHLRAICGLPLGNTALHGHCALVNIVGAPGHSGPPRYHGIRDILHTDGVYVHLYGKNETRPWRKMGHITVVAPTAGEANRTAAQIAAHLKVTT